VFITTSDEVLGRIRARGWRFYTFIGGAARFMFAWDADMERVDALATDVKACAVA
jgi:threonine aldolase